MAHRLKMWNEYDTWEEAESAWEEGVKAAAESQQVKQLAKLPSMPGITEEAKKRLKWNSLKWIISQDKAGEIRKGFLKRPFTYFFRYLKSVWRSTSYIRNKDFFYYGVQSIEEFKQRLLQDNTLFVLGFSYCHKPFECPSGRFTSNCIHDPEHPVCRQCFIGKAMNTLPETRGMAFLIPTVHYIGAKMFDLSHRFPDKNILFLITACEMTLEMFGDFGNMVGAKGIGVRLDGRICNTMKAFELSEKGIKPGLTVVLDETKEQVLDLLKHFR